MPGNAVLKIEHDTQAIYYLCVLNLGYRIVCPTIPFWSSERCTLDTSVHFSLHADCSGEQTDKTKCERWRRRWCMCLQAQKGWRRLRQLVPKCLQMSRKAGDILYLSVVKNPALSCECYLMSEKFNLSRYNLSHRNFSHGTVWEWDSLQMWSSRGGEKTTATK